MSCRTQTLKERLAGVFHVFTASSHLHRYESHSFFRHKQIDRANQSAKNERWTHPQKGLVSLPLPNGFEPVCFYFILFYFFELRATLQLCWPASRQHVEHGVTPANATESAAPPAPSRNAVFSLLLFSLSPPSFPFSPSPSPSVAVCRYIPSPLAASAAPWRRWRGGRRAALEEGGRDG